MVCLLRPPTFLTFIKALLEHLFYWGIFIFIICSVRLEARINILILLTPMNKSFFIVQLGKLLNSVSKLLGKLGKLGN